MYANNDLSTTISSTPATVTSDQTATFEFSSPFDEGQVTFSCWVDGADAVPCTSPFTTPILPEGAHGFLVAAQDPSSNWGPPASYAWTINVLSSGDGSEESPFQLSSCADIQVIHDNLSANYQLETNIDCDGVVMTPIGAIGNPFIGTLDGNGYTISNVILTSSTYDSGIFGRTENASFSNLYLDNITISGTDNVGALIGTATYTTTSRISLTNSSVTGTGEFVGGIVGYLGGSSIEKSYAEDTTVTGDNLVGGLAGIAIGPSTISQSYFQGIIDGATNVGGITGQVGAGPAYVTETYADVSFTNAGSDIVGAIGSGASETRNFIANAPYLENNSQAPLGTWDFVETWYVRSGNYPGLQPLVLPQMLCVAPGASDTSVTVGCTTQPTLSGPTTWEVKYGYSDATSWTNLSSQAGASFGVTINDLLPGTDYRVLFRYTNDIGTSQWGSQEITTTGNSDIDGDGKSNKEEFKGPNSGDANSDGTPDYTQANVTTFIGTDSSKYVVLKTSCNNNFNVQIGLESSESKDAGFNYPAGLVGFVARGCSVGASAIFSLYFYDQSSSNLVLRKWQNGIYKDVPGATIQQVTIGGKSVAKASYQVTDGGSLDDDGIADGNIVDPVGLAASIVTVPNTGFRQN